MNESIKFGRWLIIHTSEVTNTMGPCRRYKNKVYTIDELYPMFLNWVAGL